MTALMCQVTSALCNIEVDGTNWNDHLTSKKHLQNCKYVDNSVAINFFEMIFEARPERKKKIDLKNEKTLNFWRSINKTSKREI